jgi:hypothetical protein
MVSNKCSEVAHQGLLCAVRTLDLYWLLTDILQKILTQNDATH